MTNNRMRAQILITIRKVPRGHVSSYGAIARAAGLLIGSGSDLLGQEQNRRGLEVTLQAAVLGPMEAIVCATLSNACIMRQEREFGSIEAGKLADVIAIKGDPLSNPELFDDPARVVLVIKGGKIVKNLM